MPTSLLQPHSTPFSLVSAHHFPGTDAFFQNPRKPISPQGLLSLSLCALNLRGRVQSKLKTMPDSALAFCCSVAGLCLTLCDPMDCSTPGSSVHEISQARYLSGLPFPPPGVLPSPGMEPMGMCLLHWRANALPLSNRESHFPNKECALTGSVNTA